MTTVVEHDSRSAAREVVRKVSTIATLPEVTANIIRVVEDPRSSAQQLHKIVSHDPALVSRILKVVNSAFYGLPGQIGSVERAIVLLGLNAVKNIAVAASLGQLFRGGKICQGFTARDLWIHCVSVAVVARELAKSMKVPLVDEAFLAGMIHDIGLLVSLQNSPDMLRAICEQVRQTQAPFCQVERELTGMDHAMLGQALTELWKFPQSCQHVAGWHHEPLQISESNRLLGSLVFVADTLCCEGGHGFNLTALHQKLDAVGLTDLKIDPALIERIRPNLPQIIADAGSLFG